MSFLTADGSADLMLERGFFMKVIFRMIFMCLMSVGVMGSLMACGNAENNDTNKEKTLSAEDKINVGDYLFNADKMETVEISGEDIYRKKK